MVLNFYPSFGGEPDEQSMARIKNSPAWDGRRFVNPEPTVIQTGDNMPSLGGVGFDDDLAACGQKSERAASWRKI
nr:hypothetical protein [uncultured Campylobacter sp.]